MKIIVPVNHNRNSLYRVAKILHHFQKVYTGNFCNVPYIKIRNVAIFKYSLRKVRETMLH